METLRFSKKLLEENFINANEIRTLLNKKNIFTINLLGSPGAGKTSILEKVIESLGEKGKIAVIEGDLYTTRDANRLERYGTQVVQVNTEGICHLEASMIMEALNEIKKDFIELKDFIQIFQLSCEHDIGIQEFCNYLRDKADIKKSSYV